MAIEHATRPAAWLSLLHSAERQLLHMIVCIGCGITGTPAYIARCTGTQRRRSRDPRACGETRPCVRHQSVEILAGAWRGRATSRPATSRIPRRSAIERGVADDPQRSPPRQGHATAGSAAPPGDEHHGVAGIGPLRFCCGDRVAHGLAGGYAVIDDTGRGPGGSTWRAKSRWRAHRATRDGLARRPAR